MNHLLWCHTITANQEEWSEKGGYFEIDCFPLLHLPLMRLSLASNTTKERTGDLD